VSRNTAPGAVVWPSVIELAVLALTLTQGIARDTAVYANSATAALVTSAAARHSRQVSRLGRYSAQVRTRAEGFVKPGRFGPEIPLLRVDLAASVQWQRPSDVSVVLLGARTHVARLPGTTRETLGGWFVGLVTAEPWFAPGAMGDEIDFMGIPDEPALHPLAPGADALYHYAIVDSVRMILPGRTVRSVAVAVEPRRYDKSLVQGTMWLDADSLDVVRLSVAFVGRGLWDDDDDESPRLLGAEADLEYALHEGQYWLPYRQILTLDWRYRYLPGATLPARAISTFDDYRLTEVPPIVFQRRTSHARLGDECDPWSYHARADCGTRRGVRLGWDGDLRYQVVTPPLDSLARFDFGDGADRSATFDEDAVGRRLTEMAIRSGTLPAEARVQDRPMVNPLLVAAIRDGVRFNRVQGPSLGGTVRLRTGALTTLEPTVRGSAGDERITGALLLRHDDPQRDVWLQARHQLREAEPWTSGLSFVGTLRSAFLGDDAADYYLVTGASGGLTVRLGRGRGLRVELGWERQRSVTATDGSVLNDVVFGDGQFLPNPAIVEGDFGRVMISRLFGDVGSPTLEVGIEGLGGSDLAAARGWIVADAPFDLGRRHGDVEVRAGHMIGDSLPQLEFRAGGRYTVRGYEYGVRRGRGAWSVQSEVEIVPNAWVAPVALIDIGNVIGPGSGDPLIGVGLGLSVGNGWLRLDLVKGVNPAAVVRADLGIKIAM
jgi:Haemolysin secretion/activation protein ShlB/FhaC/HecB